MPSILIIGAGANIGRATAQAFAKAGYAVGVASRSPSLGDAFKHFPFDASKPETVSTLFKDFHAAIGPPSVVLYNVAKDNITANPFEISIDKFNDALVTNATTPWVVASESVKSFEQLSSAELESTGATFIYTGNLLNVAAAPGFVTFGMGKSAASHLVQALALVSFQDKPYKFYYADQRKETGDPVPIGLDGEAHSKLFLDLAKDPEQRPWQQTFVQGKGYVSFPRQEAWFPGKKYSPAQIEDVYPRLEDMQTNIALALLSSMLLR